MTNQFKSAIPNLDNSKIHSPAELREWKNSKYQERHEWDVQQAEIARAAWAEKQKANAPLSEDEYYQQAVERERQKRERELTAKLQEESAAQERIDYLASSPLTAHIYKSDPFNFLTEFQHWASKGYEMNMDTINFSFPSTFIVTMSQPAAKPAKKAAQ